MSSTVWSVLPNAAHIDSILESLKTHPEIWDSTENETLIVALDAALNAARTAALNAARDASWGSAAYSARAEARYATRYVGQNAGGALSAIAALVAWDDSAQFLEMDGDALEVYAKLSDDPRAILMLPAVHAFERIKKLKSV